MIEIHCVTFQKTQIIAYLSSIQKKSNLKTADYPHKSVTDGCLENLCIELDAL